MRSKGHYNTDRAALRRAILVAARRLFVGEGFRNVSIRKIAERVGYSPAAIYTYFADKAEIGAALAEEGFARFGRAMAAGPRDADPLAALEQHFWRYYLFSTRHSHYYWLMFVDRSVPRVARAWERYGPMKQMRADAIDLIGRCVDAGLLPAGTSAPVAFKVLVTAVHGAAVARMSGRFCTPRDGDALAQDTLRTAIAGLRTGSVLGLETARPGR